MFNRSYISFRKFEYLIVFFLYPIRVVEQGNYQLIVVIECS